MTKRHHILASLLVLGVVLAVAATPAMAEHTYTPNELHFGSGHFEGVAVDQETGNVYVDNHGRAPENEPEAVDVFSADGGLPADGVPKEFLVPTEHEGKQAGPVAVDNACEQQKLTETTTPKCSEFDPSNGDVYVGIVYEHEIAKLALNAGHEYEVVAELKLPISGSIEGIAVDDQGNVYVASIVGNSANPIVEFKADGEMVKIEQHMLKEPIYLAVGSPGVLYVGNSHGNGRKGIVKIVVGSSETMLDPDGNAVAVDPRTGIVYGDNVSSISEYNSAGDLLGSFGEGVISESRGVAVNAASGEVYVSNGLSNKRPVDAFEEVFEPGAKISEEQVTGVNATAATLQAQINPNKSPVLSCVFEYGTSGAYGQSLPCAPASLATGEASVPVSARVEGLQPGVSYHYRVVAVSEVTTEVAGKQVTKNEDFDGPDEILTTPALPGSPPETCPNAQLRLEQPFGLGLPDCRAYELVSPLDKNDNDVEPTDARASVSDESPALAYLSAGAFSEPRGAEYEDRYLARRGADGWVTQNITPPANTASGTYPPFSELLFTPELTKGLVKSIFDPLVEGEPVGFVNLYVADLASDPASYRTVTSVTPPGQNPYEGNGEGSIQVFPGGVSTDLSHVVFQQSANLTAGASGSNEHVYEWAAGKLSQVDVPPERVKFGGEDSIGAPSNGDGSTEEGADTWHAVSATGSRIFFTGGEVGPYKNKGQLYVREDPTGSSEEECSGPGTACTVEVSASQKTNGSGPKGADPHGPQPAYFRDASSNGEEVFFTSRAELTNDAYTGPDDNAANLYECQLIEVEEEPACNLTDLTVPTTPKEEAEDPNGATVLGVVNASEDGSYVYFVANGVLASNENAAHQKAERGSCPTEQEESEAGEHMCSLYVEHYNGSAWEPPVFVATLAAGDLADWIGYESGQQSEVQLNQDFGPGSHTARVTANGTTLAFESERSLTGYNNQQSQRGECEGRSPTGLGTETGKCREVFVYHAPASPATEPGSLVCASCDPSGARPVGPAQLGGHPGKANGESPFYLPRNLSESGGRLFFQTPDPLVSTDTDGKVDVYEWEQPATPTELANGESTCTFSSSAFAARSGGCIYPISDIAGDDESDFMDATPNGNDVFIATSDHLVPEADSDSRTNVYDVRVGGGFPVVSAPAQCGNADACKPPESPQPAIFGAPASATFSGPANPTPAVAPPPKKLVKKTVKCKKPKKLSHGKCVKPKKRAKKSSHGKGRA